jgi:hypothetical protein
MNGNIITQMESIIYRMNHVNMNVDIDMEEDTPCDNENGNKNENTNVYTVGDGEVDEYAEAEEKQQRYIDKREAELVDEAERIAYNMSRRIETYMIENGHMNPSKRVHYECEANDGMFFYIFTDGDWTWKTTSSKTFYFHLWVDDGRVVFEDRYEGEPGVPELDVERLKRYLKTEFRQFVDVDEQYSQLINGW